MKRIQQTLTVTGPSNPVMMNEYASPQQVGLQFNISGTASYTLQLTCDDITSSSFSAATAMWTTVTGIVASAASGYATLLNQPCTAIRTSGSVASGSVLTVTYIQPSNK